MRRVFMLSLMVGTIGCSDYRGQQPRYENYGDIYQKNGNSLIIPESRHGIGWGKDDCFMCHNINNIHRVSRISTLKIDLDIIRQKVAKEGLTSCELCHGTNGVSQ